MTDRQSGGATHSHRGTATRDTTDMSDSTGRDTGTATRKMKDVDHAPPVEGARRSFERRGEGHPPRTDGGRDEEAAEDATGETDSDEEGATPDGGFTQKMKEMDHTPPVDGAKRTFERGRDDDESDGVRE